MRFSRTGLALAAALVAACGGAASNGDTEPDAAVDAGPFETPRLLAPLSTTMVRDLRPTLRWTGGEGDTFTLEVSPLRDFDEVEYSWTGIAFEHEVETDLAPGPWFWRVSMPGPEGEVLVSHTWSVFTGRVPYDVNGDGVSDLVVSTSKSVSVYFYSGLDIEGTLTTDDATAVVGRWLDYRYLCSSFSDLDDDGIADIVIGQADDFGNLFICRGSDDLQGDVDIGTCHRIRELEQSYDYFGSLFSPRGDVDGDGRFDLLVSAPHYYMDDDTPYSGIVHLYLSAGSPVADHKNRWDSQYTFLGDTAYDSIVARDIVPDFNGDGFSDLLMGSEFNSMKGWLVFGGPDLAGQGSPQTADVSLLGGSSTQGFFRMTSAGDVNGDGYGDIVMVYRDGQEYWVSALGGGEDVPAFPTASDMLIRIKHPDSHGFGAQSIIPFGPGDVNGNGYADIGFTMFGNLGVDGYNVDPLGAVYIVYGGPDLPEEMHADDADIVIIGNGDPWFANYASGVGDVNGDGYMDFAVSATGDPIGEHDLFPGRVFVFFGGPTLEQKETADDADAIISSTMPDEVLGMCINHGGV